MGNFSDERLSSEFQLVLAFFNEVSELEGLQLHDAADAEAPEIFTLVEISQNILEIKL